MNASEKKREVEHLANLLLFSQRPPARTTALGAAVVLGMTDVEIGVLVSKGILKPLGKPTEMAAKLFATRELLSFAEDKDWLSKATQMIQSEWRHRNAVQRARKQPAGTGEN